MTTVDRLRWIEERVRHLESVRDDASLSAEDRAAAETELEMWHTDSAYRWRWVRRFGMPSFRNRGVARRKDGDDG